MFTIFPWLNVTLSCFKQALLKDNFVLVPQESNVGVRMLLDVVGSLIPSLDNPLDVHDKTVKITTTHFKIFAEWLEY